MTDQIQITAEDITKLAEKLDKLKLEDNERALLSAIITMATQLISTHHSVDAVPLFKQQFETSFTPGHATALVAFAATVHSINL